MDTLRFRQIDSLDLEGLTKEFMFFMEHAERVNWDISDETMKYMLQLQRLIQSLS